MAGVPASGVGPGDLKPNSVVCERSVGAARSIDPVFFPSNGDATHTKRHSEKPGGVQHHSEPIAFFQRMSRLTHGAIAVDSSWRWHSASISVRLLKNSLTTARGETAISKRPSAWVFLIAIPSPARRLNPTGSSSST